MLVRITYRHQVRRDYDFEECYIEEDFDDWSEVGRWVQQMEEQGTEASLEVLKVEKVD